MTGNTLSPQTHAWQATRTNDEPDWGQSLQGTSPPAVSQDGANNEEKRNGQQHGTRNGTEAIRGHDGNEASRSVPHAD